KLDPAALQREWATSRAKTVVLKENRGGSRAYVSAESGTETDAPAYPTHTEHSVGVGDCFDATWVAGFEDESPGMRLRSSAYVSSLYASTFDHCAFVEDVRAAIQIGPSLASIAGTRIPWERRPAVNIYLAAPDFP